MSTRNYNVGIIGGGISGLCAGYALREKGVNFTIYEQASAPGGVIKTIERNGWRVELGPNTLMARSERLLTLIDELNLNEQVVRAGTVAQKRYIVKNDKTVPIPNSLMEFLKTDLLSGGAKLRLLKEPFISKKQDNESIGSFFERRLGKEVEEYLVNPFVAGIYAGDPRKLSMRHTFSSVYELEKEHGSLLMGALKSAVKRDKSRASGGLKGLISFKKGLRQLPDALYKHLESDLQLESKVEGISITGGKWAVDLNRRSGKVRHDALIFTAPLHQLPPIRFEMEYQNLLENLSKLRYAPIVTVTLGFERSQVDHPLDGFGMLVPGVESRTILGSLFSSSLFENRAPEGHVLLTSFVGGERNPGLVEKTEDEVRDLVLDDLQPLLGITGRPKFEHMAKLKHAIPQYELNHQSFLDRIEKLEGANTGLFFTGNFRSEVSVPGCIEQAYETVENVASFLES